MEVELEMLHLKWVLDLYNNHIISVTVETKDKPEINKKHAESLSEVIIDKIAENEYTRRM